MILRSAIRFAVMLGAVSALAACSGGGGLFQLPRPDGVFTEQVVGSSTIVPATSLTSPLQVHNGFSLLVSEGHYSDVFSAQILSYTATTPAPCYTVAMDSSGHTVIFTPVISPPPPPQGCPFPGDVESVKIQDVSNRSTIIFFQNIGP